MSRALSGSKNDLWLRVMPVFWSGAPGYSLSPFLRGAPGWLSIWLSCVLAQGFLLSLLVPSPLIWCSPWQAQISPILLQPLSSFCLFSPGVSGRSNSRLLTDPWNWHFLCPLGVCSQAPTRYSECYGCDVPLHEHLLCAGPSCG